MRRAVLGLLAAAGCNQIWGLGPVGLEPGDSLKARITTQVTRTTSTGALDPALDYIPVAPAPAIELGPLDGELQPAEYADDGTVAYPAALAGAPWRLVYTLGDGLPREVRWSPDGDLTGHLTAPLFGRVERQPVPDGSGYSITPMTALTSHAMTRVFTTGVWTEGTFPGTINATTIDYDFAAQARPFSGALAAPERARGDHAVLADYKIVTTPSTSCRVSSGVSTFPVPDLVPGARSVPVPQPEYFSADKQARVTLSGPRPVGFRLLNALGDRASATHTYRMEYGYTPSLGVSGFSRPALSSAPDVDFALPGPRLITLASCMFSVSPYLSETFADPAEIRDRFPALVHVEVANQRTRGALALTSGFAAVVSGSNYMFTADFAAPAPVRIRLVQDGAQIADLEALAAEPTPLPALAPMDLVFDVEADPGLTADLFEITLHLVTAAGQLAPQRVFTTTERTLALDPALFQPGAEYVLELRALTGRPNAARGDLATNTYPQYAATVFTRTFKTP